MTNNQLYILVSLVTKELKVIKLLSVAPYKASNPEYANELEALLNTLGTMEEV